jgi:hypothetical protein
MRTFTVRRRVDAWIDYVAEVKAESASVAATLACADNVTWRRVGEEEFWNARFATLDENNSELPETVIARG